VDKSLDSSTQTEPRNTQLGYFRRLFEQDCDLLLVKTNQSKSPYEYDNQDYENKLEQLKDQIRSVQRNDSSPKDEYDKGKIK